MGLTKNSKGQIADSARALFEALAPSLIEHGITSPEVENLLRAVLVHEAARVFAQQGRKPNASKVSIKTGIDRHLVAGLLKRPPEVDSLSSSRRDVTSRVLNAWLRDSDYSRRRRPRVLEIGDPHTRGRTAWALVQKYAPGVWPRLVIDELIRLNYVDVLPGGLIRCRTRASHPVTPKASHASSTSRRVKELSRSIVQSLFSRQRGTWRTGQSYPIARSKLPLVRKMMRERLERTFAELSEELGSTRWGYGKDESEPQTTIGIAVFAFEQMLEG